MHATFMHMHVYLPPPDKRFTNSTCGGTNGDCLCHSTSAVVWNLNTRIQLLHTA